MIEAVFSKSKYIVHAGLSLFVVAIYIVMFVCPLIGGCGPEKGRGLVISARALRGMYLSSCIVQKMGNDRRDHCYLNPQMGVQLAKTKCSFAALLSLLQLAF